MAALWWRRRKEKPSCAQPPHPVVRPAQDAPRIVHVVLNHFEAELSKTAGRPVFSDVVSPGYSGYEIIGLEEFARRYQFSPEDVEQILYENGLVTLVVH
jgi:hypothetical protein